jgi:hypothetical protein
MATPRFDLISITFAKKIGDGYDNTGALITNAATDGLVLTAAVRNGIVAQALLNFFNTYWEKFNTVIKDSIKAKELFIALFPELGVSATIGAMSGSTYPIASPYLNYFTIIEAIVGGCLATVQPQNLFYTVQYGNPQFKGDTTHPVIIEIGRTIYTFPSSFSGTVLAFNYIQQPVDPTTGLLLSQGGSYDSPFTYTWTDPLVQACEKLYSEYGMDNK